MMQRMRGPLVGLFLVAGSFCGCGSGDPGGATGRGGDAGAATGRGGDAGARSEGGGGGLGGAAGAASAGTTGGAGMPGGPGGASVAGSGGRAGSGGNAGRAGGVAGGSAGGTGGTAGTGVANACSSRPGLIFCDSFEAAAAGSTPSVAPWATQIIGAGTVTVDGTQSTPGGQRSVHMNGGSSDYDTLLVLRSTSILPAASGRFYLRFFARFNRALATGHNTFLLADVFARQGQGNNFRFGEDGGFLEYTTLGDSNAAHATGLQIPPSTWTCIEILLDHVKPEVDVWINGAEIADMHHTNYPLDGYDNVRFGFEKYAGPALEAWYDDIAVGTERIGCQ
jgi:hypothetical protein